MTTKTNILAAGLFVSLLGNCFLGGHLIGRFHGHPGMMPPNAAADKTLRDKLSEADRKVMKQAMEQGRERMDKLHDELESARKAVGDAVKAEPFDPAALDAALTKEKNEKMAFLLTIREARADISQKLSPQGRALLSKMNHLRPGKPPKDCPPPPVE